MVDINTLPAIVLWKNQRVNFSNIESSPGTTKMVLVTGLEDEPRVTAQLVDLSNIDEKDVQFATCKENNLKMCDFNLPQGTNGAMSMYCCRMCTIHKQSKEL